MKMMEGLKQNRYASLAVVLLFAAGIFFSLHTFRKHGGDFENYYYGSRLYLEGKFNSDVYECYRFNHLIEMKGEKGLFCNYTPVPPFTAVFFAPFAALPHETSRLVFSLTGLLFFCFVLWKFLVNLEADSIYLLFLPLLLFIPVRSNIMEGQLYFWLGGFLLGAFLFHKKGKYFFAAVFFALSIHLKIFPAIFLVYLLFTPGYRAFIYTLMNSFLILVVLHFAIESSVLHHYFTSIFSRLMRGEINDPFATAYQSVSVFFRQMLVNDADLNPSSLLNLPEIFLAVDLFFKLLFLLSAIFVSRSKKFSPLFIFAWWLMVMMLLSGYGAEYSLILWALIAFVFVLHADGKGKFIFSFLGLLLISIPAGFYMPMKFPLNFPRLFLELTLFIIAWLWFRPRFISSVSFIVSPLFILLFFLQQGGEEQHAAYFYPQGNNLLTSYYTYSDKDSVLILSTYGRNGAETNTVHMNHPVVFNDMLFTDGHRVSYSGHLLYTSSNNIIEPSICDGKLLFLSDEGRGPGMYALRMTEPIEPLRVIK